MSKNVIKLAGSVRKGLKNLRKVYEEGAELSFSDFSKQLKETFEGNFNTTNKKTAETGKSAVKKVEVNDENPVAYTVTGNDFGQVYSGELKKRFIEDNYTRSLTQEEMSQRGIKGKKGQKILGLLNESKDDFLLVRQVNQDEGFFRNYERVHMTDESLTDVRIGVLTQNAVSSKQTDSGSRLLKSSGFLDDRSVNPYEWVNKDAANFAGALNARVQKQVRGSGSGNLIKEVFEEAGPLGRGENVPSKQYAFKQGEDTASLKDAYEHELYSIELGIGKEGGQFVVEGADGAKSFYKTKHEAATAKFRQMNEGAYSNIKEGERGVFYTPGGIGKTEGFSNRDFAAFSNVHHERTVRARNQQRYGSAYLDEGVREDRIDNLLERAMKVGVEDVKTVQQQRGFLESRLAGEVKKQEGFSQDMADGLLAKFDEKSAGRDFYLKMSKDSDFTLDSPYFDHDELAMAVGDLEKQVMKGNSGMSFAEARNKEILDTANKVGVSEDSLRAYASDATSMDPDDLELHRFYRVSKGKGENSMDKIVFEHELPTQRGRFGTDEFGEETFMLDNNRASFSKPEDVTQARVRLRNRMESQTDDFLITTRKPKEGQPKAESPAGGDPSQQKDPRTGQPKNIQDYVDADAYKQLRANSNMSNSMYGAASGSIYGAGVGAVYSAYDQDAGISSGDKLGKSVKNMMIGAIGGGMGAAGARHIVESSMRSGSTFRKGLDFGYDVAKNNPEGFYSEPLREIASVRGLLRGDLNAGNASRRIESMNKATRNSMYAGTALGGAMALRFGSKDDKSRGLNKKRGNKF